MQFAVVARRFDLDDALVKRARQVGATVHDGHAFRSITVHDDHVEVIADGLDPLRARFVIGADGMWSPLRKALGATPLHYLGEWHAFRQYFTNVTGRAADKMIVWFEPSVLPGYVWSFPLGDGRANVGFGITRDARHPHEHDEGAVAGAARDAAHRRRAGRACGRRVAAPRVADPGRASTRSRLTAPRTLFVGDAAAATDVMTGEGIAQALLTGMLAARAVIERRGRCDARRARYETVGRAARCSPITACRWCCNRCSRDLARSTRRCASPALTRLDTAQLRRAGSSRTIRGRCCSPRGDGTARCSAPAGGVHR